MDKGDDEEWITRRYLMHDSKINSTLKLGVIMRHVEGDRSFSTYVLLRFWICSPANGFQTTAEIITNGL